MESQFIKVENRRMGDPTLNLIAAKLETLHEDVSDMKSGLKDLAVAITKLAVVEERLATSVQAQERAFKAIEGVQGEVKVVSARVSTLEQAAPMQKKTSDWILAAVWGGAGLTVATIAHKIGLI